MKTKKPQTATSTSSNTPQPHPPHLSRSTKPEKNQTQQSRQPQLYTIATLTSGLRCPKCNSRQYIRYGFYKDTQQYRCKDCKRSFGETTNTALHGLHKKTIIEPYIQTMEDGLTLRKASSKLGISLTTAFRWRHRLLASINGAESTTNKPTGLSIITLPHSCKGKHNKSGHEMPPVQSIALSAANGAILISKLEHKNEINDAATAISKKITSGTIVAFNRDTHIRKIAKQLDVTVNRHYHLGKALAQANTKLQTNLEDWLYRFRGVATKYLQQYWAWYCTVSGDHAANLKETCLGYRQLEQYRLISAQ